LVIRKSEVTVIAFDIMALFRERRAYRGQINRPAGLLAFTTVAIAAAASGQTRRS
jgi:hypothetical protein